MTNHWNDIANSDYILVIGANPAENHPISFRHVTKAIEAGGKLIVVDPRFTRSASKAHLYAPLRSGTDIAFINGMINRVLSLGPSVGGSPGYNEDYVLWYSNAGFLLLNTYKGVTDQAAPLDGLFSGWTPPAPGTSPGSYSKATWGYATDPVTTRAIDLVKDFWDANGDCKVHGAACPDGWKRSVLTLDGLAAWRQHLAAAGQLPANAGLTSWEETKRHLARYTPTLVSAITGCPQATLLATWDEYAGSGVPSKSGVIMYAMGTTQHTVGTQNIRAYSVLQILLGNMGVAGGGIAAMRGESNVQGSTDWGLLYHILTSYLKVPDGTVAGDATVAGYLTRTTPKLMHTGETNWWGNTPKYFVSYLANMWDDLGVGDGTNNWTDPNGVIHNLPPNTQAVYDRLPKIPGNCSHISIFEKMAAGQIKGLIAFGQNPAVAGPNSKVARNALRNLDWLVVSELWETETAAFWQNNVQGAALKPSQKAAIKTEVFLLPAAGHMEKEGTIANSGRWTQYRYKAVEPPGGDTLGARHEIKILNQLYDRLRGQIPDAQIQNLNMGTHWYGTDDPPADYLDREINGSARTAYNAWFGATNKAYNPGDLITSFAYLTSTGASSNAGWVYCGMYNPGTLTAGGTNKAKNRSTAQTAGQAAISSYPNWSWCWPVNRRIIYNRASVRPRTRDGIPAGQPWDAGHMVQRYNCVPTPDGFVAPGAIDGSTSYTVNDVIDGGFVAYAVNGVDPTKKDTVKSPCELGPYIMQNEGHCRLFGGFTMADGPLPEHYEPLENPFGMPDLAGRGANPMGHGQLVNPAAKIWRQAEIGDPATYPIIGTTYRMSEHWQAGAQTRNLPWLVELVPNVIVEMSKELAAAKGIAHGGRVKVSTPRGAVTAYAVVTDRFKPFVMGAKTVHQIGVIWHFGFKGLAKGHSANLLTPHVGCANTMIPEYKAFRCSIKKMV